MGLSTKKQTSTTDQNTTMNTTPTNPAFVTQGIGDLAGKINDVFGSLDPSKLVAGANPLQTQAGATASGLTGSPWNFDSAMDLTRGVANGTTPQTAYVNSSPLIEQFMNPYIKDVANTALADYDFGAGMTRAQDKLAKANDSVFGGSGGAIQTALSNDAINRGRGTLSAGLYKGGFDTALSAAQAEAARKQSANDLNAQLMGQGQDRTLNAAGQLANLTTAQDANTRANAGTQFDVGGALRDITNQQNQAPITTLLQQIAAFTGLPLDLLKGSTSTGTLSGKSTGTESGISLGDLLGYFAANARAAASSAGGGG